MATLIEEILANFCALSKREKRKLFSEYQQKLQVAYKGERIICLPHDHKRGLEEEGGRLFADFLQQHPYIEEIYLTRSMLNEVDKFGNIESTAGFDAFLWGLVHTKQANKLRVLDLSSAKYSPQQLGKLTEQVLMNHPTFTTLILETTFFTDQHLEAMLPYLSCPQLKRISLHGNLKLEGDGTLFNQFIDKLLSDCPSLQFIDIDATSITANSTAALAVMRLLTTNRQVFVNIPQDGAVQNQSIKNHYEYFIPSYVTLMQIDFANIKAQFEQFGISTQGVAEMLAAVRSHDARFTHIETRVKQTEECIILLNQLSKQSEEAQQQLQQTIHVQCLKQILMERQLSVTQADSRDFKTNIQVMKEQLQSTQTYVQDINERVKKVTIDSALTKDIMVGLEEDLARQTDALDNIDEHMEKKLTELRAIFNNFEIKMQLQSERLSDAIPADLSPTELAYVKKFKFLIVQMVTVAIIACEGSLQLGSSGHAGTAATILNILSNVAPGPTGGVVLSVFAYLFQAIDEKMAKERLEIIAQLGTPDEMHQLATELSCRLLRCLTLEHHVKKGSLTKLLSTTQGFFYGTLFNSVQSDGALPVLTNAGRTVTILDIENRAKQDAKLLFSAIVKEGVPTKEGAVDCNRLFLYAAPILTVIDYLFLIMFKQFCQEQEHPLSRESEKRQKFYGHVAQSWHDHAEAVALRMENPSQREIFINTLSHRFLSQHNSDNTVGIFDLKTPHTLFGGVTDKPYVSIRKQAIEFTLIDATISTTLNL